MSRILQTVGLGVAQADPARVHDALRGGGLHWEVDRFAARTIGRASPALGWRISGLHWWVQVALLHAGTRGVLRWLEIGPHLLLDLPVTATTAPLALLERTCCADNLFNRALLANGRKTRPNRARVLDRGEDVEALLANLASAASGLCSQAPTVLTLVLPTVPVAELGSVCASIAGLAPAGSLLILATHIPDPAAAAAYAERGLDYVAMAPEDHAQVLGERWQPIPHAEWTAWLRRGLEPVVRDEALRQVTLAELVPASPRGRLKAAGGRERRS
ncbi:MULTISPECIES: hypothetical protein [unclassified Crossiella]|uniref:hypothetical protein n=1 Tax=unclassified Crossiella TaxID=2620835 RepID=UPI001FFEEBA9|nr:MULTISPECIES: hypothetical protein [unclassified Crossiella]MCK2240946.1 hypothetical protein [Crossiella sp. S99.2]MCK2253910.1 hypothetical protein [Crossiella sp. S99.1]